MKKAKKTVSLILTAVMLISIIITAPTTVSAANTNIFNVGNYNINTVVSYASSKVGTSYANGYCLAFVKQIFADTCGFTSTACCAYKYGNSFIDSTSKNNIPVGADVFFGGSNVICSCGSKAGHIGIYVGDGMVIHAWSGKVVKTSLDYIINCGYPYRGWGWHGNQSFYMPPADTQPPVIPTGTRTLSDGEYHIVSAVNNSYGLSVANGSLNNYANVLIYDSMEDTDTKSLVTVKYLGDGTYSLTFKNSGKVLNVEGGSKASGANVIQYDNDGTKAGKWIIKETGDGHTFYIISSLSGMYLDLNEGKATSGNNIKVYNGNSTNAQKWSFIASGLSTGQTVSDGEYHIVSSTDNSYGLDVHGGNTSDGTNIQLYKNSTDSTQTFNVKYLGSGYYEIQSTKSKKNIDLSRGYSYSGTNVHIWSPNSYNSSKLILKPTGDDYYIISKNAGLTLDIHNGTIANGTNIWGFVNNGSNAQKWKFVKVPKVDRTSKVHINYDTNGGEMRSTNIGNKVISQINGSRSENEMVIYDSDFYSVNTPTNCYGMELGFDKDGKRVSYRKYEDQTPSAIRYGGFVASEHRGSLIGSIVDRINFGYCDYSGKKVYFYENQVSYNYEVKDLSKDKTYGSMPTPTREGYRFDGWYTAINGGTKVTSTTEIGSVNLYAHWSKSDNTSETQPTTVKPTETTESTQPTTKPTETTATEPTEVPSQPTEDIFRVVAGSPELCNGVEWDPASSLNLMILDDDGVYRITYSNVPAGTYEFKVTTNGAWDNGEFNLVGDAMYGGPNAEITVTEDNSTVVISFKESDMHANAYINGVLVDVGATEPTEPTTVNPTEPTEPTPATEEKTDISKWQVSGIYNKQYTGKYIKQDGITVYNDGEYADIKVKYRNNLNVGTATVIITGTGDYTGTITKTFKINKAENPMLTWRDTEAVSSKALKKHKVIVKGVIGAYDYQGSVTFTKLSGSKSLTISKGGVITVKKGRYKKNSILSMKVKITAKGNANYMSKSKKMTVKIKIK